MAIVSVLNLSSAFMAWRSGELIVDGKLQAPTVNLLCGLMFAAIGIVGLVKKVTDREEEA
jgi:MinD-like ATPase involved in chromosome partitioning or flagellar assembly